MSEWFYSIKKGHREAGDVLSLWAAAWGNKKVPGRTTCSGSLRNFFGLYSMVYGFLYVAADCVLSAISVILGSKLTCLQVLQYVYSRRGQ
jgi:Na+-driven multidrug efflux pump